MNQETTAPEARNHGRFSNLIAVLGFVALVPMVILILSRALHADDFTAAVLLQTFTPYVLLPAYGIALFALVQRRKVLAVISLIVLIFHIWWVVVPQWRPAQGPSEAAKQAPQLTLFSQNVLAWNEEPKPIADEIRRSNPDVIFLQEASKEVVGQIEETGALNEYQHRVLALTDKPDSIGIWSKYPLQNTSVVPMELFPAIRAEISIEDKNLVLWNIHTRPPPLEYGTLQDWQNDLAAVRRHLSDEKGATLVAGDFNAVNSHRPFRNILKDDWSEAHVYLGRGFARTWPAQHGLGGVIRIDHVLTRGQIEPVSIHETPPHGSDHRGLLTRVALL